MKKKSPPIIHFSNVSKHFSLRHQKPTLIGTLMGIESREIFTALSDVSLKIFKGEKIGIIGPNGAGKTTLLKIISGITTPTGGSVVVRGRVASLIELTAGFHPELTGEENVFLNGLIIGMTRKEIEKKYKKIATFSGLGKFMSTPLYTYSSGMALRLGFSIAVHSNPDILILDETVAVGDESFRKKAIAKINQFFKQGKTIITVSHWLDYLQEYCTRIIWVENGIVRKDGGPEVIGTYKRVMKRRK